MSDAARPIREGIATEATLSRDLADFLVEFSIVLHKRSLYPPGHPYLQWSAVRFADRLERLLGTRESVTLGVARDRLVVGSATTDPANALLRDLAQRLHRHRLAAVEFLKGAPLGEIEALLTALSGDAERGEGPIGRRLEAAAAWEHVRLRATEYASLSLHQAEPQGDAKPARDLWLELARSALTDHPEGEAPDADPLIVADSAKSDTSGTAYDAVVLDYLSRIAEEQSGRAGAGEDRLRRRVSHLLKALEPETIQRLLEAGADHAQRQQHLLDASQAVAVDAVVSVLEGAASTSHHTVSHFLLRLLHTQARHVEGRADAAQDADPALARNVARLISDWRLDDPNPGSYTAILEAMVRELPTPGPGQSETRCDPELVVRAGVEVGSAGAAVRAAAEALAGARQLARLAEILDASESGVARQIWAYVATPDRLRAELDASVPDAGVITMLTKHLGAESADPLLDALGRASNRSSRASIMKHLLLLGPDGAAAAVARLPDAPWYLQRNILLLIGQWRAWPDGFAPHAYATGSDARVRREAIKLMIASSEHRAEGVMTGLRDPDDGIVALALSAGADACPAEALPLVERIATSPGRDSAVRVAAVRLLTRVRAPDTLRVLVALTLARRRWLGHSLPPKSPELLAAISALATHWREDPSAATVLRRALHHPDAEVRSAARGVSP